jgi:hypothetical protein
LIESRLIGRPLTEMNVRVRLSTYQAARQFVDRLAKAGLRDIDPRDIEGSSVWLPPFYADLDGKLKEPYKSKIQAAMHGLGEALAEKVPFLPGSAEEIGYDLTDIAVQTKAALTKYHQAVVQTSSYGPLQAALVRARSTIEKATAVLSELQGSGDHLAHTAHQFAPED